MHKRTKDRGFSLQFLSAISQHTIERHFLRHQLLYRGGIVAEFCLRQGAAQFPLTPFQPAMPQGMERIVHLLGLDFPASIDQHRRKQMPAGLIRCQIERIRN